MCEPGQKNNLLSFAMTCNLCVFQRSISPQTVGQGILLQNIRRNSDGESKPVVNGNKPSCPVHCTLPSGFELWPLLLACFILIEDEHVLSGPGSICSVSGLQGDQLVWQVVVAAGFFSEKLKSSVPAFGSQRFRDQLDPEDEFRAVRVGSC